MGLCYGALGLIGPVGLAKEAMVNLEAGIAGISLRKLEAGKSARFLLHYTLICVRHSV